MRQIVTRRSGATMEVEGVDDMAAGFAELTRATGRNVLKRSMVVAAEPIRAAIAREAPDDPRTGDPDLHRSIVASARLFDRRGVQEFHEAMSREASTTRQERVGGAVAAMRTARHGTPAKVTTVSAFVGPRHVARGAGRWMGYGRFHEFGTAKIRRNPFVARGFAAAAAGTERRLREAIRVVLDKAVIRARSRALKKAAGPRKR